MRKILIINMLLIILLNSFYNCFANENKESQKVKYEKTCETYLEYQGISKTARYAYYEKNGKKEPAYCLNPEYKGVNENMKEYSVNLEGKISNEKIWKVIVNGYPYKTLEELGVKYKEEAYTATQFAIYSIIHNRNVNDYKSIGTESGNRTLNAYKKIMESANMSNEKMNMEIDLIPESENWEVDNFYKDCLKKEYLLKSNIESGKYIVKIKSEKIDGIKILNEEGEEKQEFNVNEKFKILVPISLLIEDINFEIEVNGNVKSNPIIFGKTIIEGTQDYALTGEKIENFEYKFEDEIPQNITKIKVIKIEKESEKKIECVKFNLLDVNKEIVFEDLVTDENGEILLENLIPGKYYLKEIEAPEKYELLDEEIEVNINFNETVEITIENILKPFPEEPIKENVVMEQVKVTEKVMQEIQKTLPVTGY